MTVRTRSCGSAANDALWSGVKQTTSQRPAAGRSGDSGVGATSGSAGRWWLNEGNRFSKTTTS